ncbi:hypothetical protein OROHE_018000 [Orobanche hederae]
MAMVLRRTVRREVSAAAAAAVQKFQADDLSGEGDIRGVVNGQNRGGWRRVGSARGRRFIMDDMTGSIRLSRCGGSGCPDRRRRRWVRFSGCVDLISGKRAVDS